ncbi:Ferric reductase NAD binding domain [Geosmithia morbida]|uniref:ferric-chelate reductase (NADPH) n=1 Tax=Geosmithia morbida TaxID=1094350 RepID=A0A9P5D3D2_9HYPO|nr:Ferric reductase NAD binding domain [Geosmithia morbida]KAF4126048.1 Ferric reductase NAD binding domain [Geosmithia morbida]
MSWPYEFILDLSPEDKQLRRESIAFYALVAHSSAFAPALAYLLFRLGLTLYTRVRGPASYQFVPGSPVAKARQATSLGGLEARWVRLAWWMSDPVYLFGVHYGHRDEWILGSGWAAWMLLLCVLGTGRDYLHLTKRFGLVAVSQMPIQYLLSLKNLNPFCWVFGSSHEQVNRYHRVLGHIIFALVELHVIFYNIFLISAGKWTSRFFAPDVFAGVVASLAMTSLCTTALSVLRNYSYRLFFIVHVIAALVIPPLIWFHAHSARLYLVEALAVFLIDLVVRRITTITSPATVEVVPGTDLIKIEANLPPATLAKYQASPGSHVYLSLPAESRPSQNLTSKSSLLYEFIYNPFTVASTNSDTNTITLVVRNQAGPLTNRLNMLSASDATVQLNVLGPYGAVSKSISNILNGGFDSVLLFAGGVGATFALPIYRAILHEAPSTRVRLIWAIRSAAEATWATASVSGDAAGDSVLADDNVQLFLTGDMGVHEGGRGGGEGLEMSDMRGGGNHKRPNIGGIVDDTFRTGMHDSVAVMVCGPADMARNVRTSLKVWVNKGRRVWWHDETFGW